MQGIGEGWTGAGLSEDAPESANIQSEDAPDCANALDKIPWLRLGPRGWEHHSASTEWRAQAALLTKWQNPTFTDIAFIAKWQAKLTPSYRLATVPTLPNLGSTWPNMSPSLPQLGPRNWQYFRPAPTNLVRLEGPQGERSKACTKWQTKTILYRPGGFRFCNRNFNWDFVCMYVCMHVCIYLCMHACMDECMYACMHV